MRWAGSIHMKKKKFICYITSRLLNIEDHFLLEMLALERPRLCESELCIYDSRQAIGLLNQIWGCCSSLEIEDREIVNNSNTEKKSLSYLLQSNGLLFFSTFDFSWNFKSFRDIILGKENKFSKNWSSDFYFFILLSSNMLGCNNV